MRVFRHNERHQHIVSHLFEKKLRKANDQPMFATKRDLLCFAAVLGYEMQRKGAMEAKAIDFVDPRPFENSQEAMNLLYLLGLAVTKDGDSLRDENDDKLVSIFEEYADGGLAVLKEWMAETPTDPDGDRAILVALQKHGFLSVKNESAESVVADVEF